LDDLGFDKRVYPAQDINGDPIVFGLQRIVAGGLRWPFFISSILKNDSSDISGSQLEDME
jgi:hypothetical protein